MPTPGRRLVLALLSLATLATPVAAADTRTAQLGGGFETRIRCEGARLSYQRGDLRSVRLQCRAQGPGRGPAAVNGAVESVDLALGEEMRVLCQGARLKTRRTSRTEMRASCVAVA
jgi:hypothetical protein